LNTIEKRKTQLREKLKNKEYRDSYVSSNIDVGIAFQIRALRKLKGYSQDELAEIAEMKQERISAIENPSNSPNISTLVKIAAALNVALMVRFVSFGDLVKWDLSLSAESLDVLSFDEDPYFKENRIDKENIEGVETTDREQIAEPAVATPVIDIRDRMRNPSPTEKTSLFSGSRASMDRVALAR